MVDKLQAAEQLRRAIQMFVESVTDEQAMEISSVLPAWQIGKAYAVGNRFIYGENGVGDPAIYKVVQAHTASAEWTPDATPSLYATVGVTPAGYDEWSQPTGAHDAYNTGDIVDYNGTLYISTVDGNIYAPGIVPGQWEVYTPV